jgi:hypothetical protein
LQQQVLHNAAQLHHHYNPPFIGPMDPLAMLEGIPIRALSKSQKHGDYNVKVIVVVGLQVYQAHCKQLQATVAVKKLDLDAPHCDLVSEQIRVNLCYNVFTPFLVTVRNSFT